MNSAVRRCVIVVSLTALASCSTSRWYDYRFTPAPLEVQLQTSEDPNAEARGLVTVLGVARARDGEPDAVEMRLRLENLGTTPANLLEQSFRLVSADLQSFGPPEVRPPGDHRLQAGENVIVDVRFPLPKGKRPGDFNLSGLNSSWTVAFGERRITTSASFVRSDVGVYDPYYPRTQFGIGIGIGR